MAGSKNPLPVIAWDADIFIAWFKQEADKPLEDIRGVIDEIEAGDVALYVSTIAYTEVLDNAHAPKSRELFRQFMLRSNVVPVNVDPRVATKAAEIREKSILQNAADQSVPKIKTPDAIHAATAILYRVKELHSFDPDLRNLSGHEIVDGLEVTSPRTLKGKRPPMQDDANAQDDS